MVFVVLIYTGNQGIHIKQIIHWVSSMSLATWAEVKICLLLNDRTGPPSILLTFSYPVSVTFPRTGSINMPFPVSQIFTGLPGVIPYFSLILLGRTNCPFTEIDLIIKKSYLTFLLLSRRPLLVLKVCYHELNCTSQNLYQNL